MKTNLFVHKSRHLVVIVVMTNSNIIVIYMINITLHYKYLTTLVV